MKEYFYDGGGSINRIDNSVRIITNLSTSIIFNAQDVIEIGGKK